MGGLGYGTREPLVSKLKQLVDDIQTHAAVILCFSGSTIAHCEIISPHIRGRITTPNLVQVGAIKALELEVFCGDLIRFNRAKDDSFIAEQCQKYQNETMGETLVPELYPFTKESIEKLKTAMQRARPRDVNVALSWACGQAKSQGRHVVLADDITTLMVIDGNIGKNSLSQIEHFSDYLNIDGIIITKLDGTAKGGIALTAINDYKVPVYFIGVGEASDDLIPFAPEDYINSILGEDE